MLRALTALTRRRYCRLCRRWQADLDTHQRTAHGNQLNQIKEMRR